MSVACSIAFSATLTDFTGVYTPGASFPVIVTTPLAVGVAHVDAFPPSSVVTEHMAAPPQAESCTVPGALHPTVAPHTGVTPSEATTRTLIGITDGTPTVTGGPDPEIDR